jgi:hypothetical protein
MSYDALVALCAYEDTENWDDKLEENTLSVEKDHTSTTEDALEVEYA